MKKTVRMLVAAVMAVLSAFCVFACSGETSGGGGGTGGGGGAFSLTSFEVVETATVGYGEFYQIPSVVAQGSDGKKYPATYAVTCDGQAVEAYESKFQATKLKDYIVTYTVKANGTDYTKSTTVKVEDHGAPAIETDAAEVTVYTVGDKYTLPSITATDAAEGTVTFTTVFKKEGSDAAITIPEGGYTLNEAGKYTLTITASDSAGNTASRTLRVNVRTAPADNEIEFFGDDLSAAVGSSTYSDNLTLTYEDGPVGGRMPHGKFARIDNTLESGSGYAEYPGVKLTPRLTAEQLAAAVEAGYDGIEMSIYLDVEEPKLGTRSIYVLSITDGQKNLGALAVNTWYDFVFTGGGFTATEMIDKLAENYDKVCDSVFFYIGNDPKYVTAEQFDIVIDRIRLVKNAEVTFADEITVQSGEPFSVDDLGVTVKDGGAAVQGAQLEYYLSDSLGNDTKIEGNSFTVEEPGNYTVKAVLVDDVYVGSAEKAFTIAADLDYVKAEAGRLKAETNKDDTAFYGRVAKLRAAYDALEEGKDEYSINQLITDVFGDEFIEENKVWYYDSAVGLLQYKYSSLKNEPTSGSGFPIVPETALPEVVTEGLPDGYSRGYRFTVEHNYYILFPLSNMLGEAKDINNYESIKVTMMVDSSHSTFATALFDGYKRNDNERSYGFTSRQQGLSEKQWLTITYKLAWGAENSYTSVRPAEVPFGFDNAMIAISNYYSPDSTYHVTIVDATLVPKVSSDMAVTAKNLSIGGTLNWSDVTVSSVTVAGKPADLSSVSWKVVAPSGTESEFGEGKSVSLAAGGLYRIVGTYNDLTFDAATFAVRTVAKDKNELESFRDQYADISVGFGASAGSSMTSNQSKDIANDKIEYITDEVGGRTPEDGRYFLHFTYGKHLSPALRVTPRQSKDEIEALVEEGYDAIAIDMYFKANSYQRIYLNYTGSQAGQGVNAEPYTWQTIVMKVANGGGNLLTQYASAYEQFLSTRTLFWIENDPSLSYGSHVQEAAEAWISDIRFVKSATVSAATSTVSVNVGEEADLASFGLSATGATKFAAYAVASDGSNEGKTFSADGKITLDKKGSYRVFATVTDREYGGQGIFTLNVKATVASLKSEAAELKAETDKDSADFISKLYAFRDDYALLTDEDRQSWPIADVIDEIFGADALTENQAFYAGPIGILQAYNTDVSADMYNPNTPGSPFGGEIVLVDHESDQAVEEGQKAIRFTVKSSTSIIRIPLCNLASNIDGTSSNYIVTVKFRVSYASAAIFVSNLTPDGGSYSRKYPSDKKNDTAANTWRIAEFDIAANSYTLDECYLCIIATWSGNSTPANGIIWLGDVTVAPKA